MRNVVIVGTGIAGVSAASALRSAGYDGRVSLIGDEPELPYRRPPLSKDVLRGEKTGDAIRIKSEGWYADNAISLVTGATVKSVDVAGRRVGLADGSWEPYDRLLLATGGRPRLLPSIAKTRVEPGSPAAAHRGHAGLDRVRTLRRLSDVPALAADMHSGESVLVIGGGLIGAEVAASARAMGCPVTLLEAAPTPLARLLPPVVAQPYAGLHRDHGVDLHTNVSVAGIAQSGDGLLVTTSEGRRFAARTVVCAVGMTPATELAERAGIAVDDGIVVDASGATSAPGVFAAGDVANCPNLVLGGRHRVEHWQHALNQGTTVARAMLGESVSFGEVPWCWSDQYGFNLQVTGWPSASDDVRISGDLAAMDFLAVFSRGGRLTGAMGIGRAAEIRRLRKLIAEDPYAEPPVAA